MEVYSISFLGSSQTFVGILATLIILCIGRNDNNFIYEVLKDIKSQIVEYTKRIKPTISLDSVKESSDYKSIFLFTQNEKYKETYKDLYEECTKAIGNIDLAKFELQAKITNWDNNVINFADAIENKKEQQKGPMFAFAYSIVIFIFDELLRCQYVPFDEELLAILSLFSIYVSLYWLVKWLVFMLRDDYAKDKTSVGECNGHFKLLRKFVSLKNRWQFLIHLAVTFFLLHVVAKYSALTNEEECLCGFLLCSYVPFILFGLIHMFKMEKHSEERITMHYVYHFFYMLFLSVGILFFVKECFPSLLDIVPFQDSTYLFWLKALGIGFILCVGLLCPFICTLLKYNMVYIHACVKFIWLKMLSLYKSNKLRVNFMDLAGKLPVN